MHAYLTGTLTEHGLRRLAKVVDSAVQAVHAALLDQVGVRCRPSLQKELRVACCWK